MKKMKKVLAVLLCLCLAMTAMVFSVSAEDTEGMGWVYLNSAKATVLSAEDNETVLQMELDVDVYADGVIDPETAALFDTVNMNAEIAIYQPLIMIADQLSGSGEVDLQKAMIAKAKPVSYEDGILTVDVCSKDGKPGAKMVAADVEISADGESVSEYYGIFRFDFPQGMFSDSASGAVSTKSNQTISVEGLATKTIKLPKMPSGLVVGMIVDYMNGNIAGLVGKAALLLPILPVVLLILAARANDYCKVYGLNAYRIVFSVIKLAPELIKELIGYVFR